MVRSPPRQNAFHLGFGFAFLVLATVVMMGSVVRSLFPILPKDGASGKPGAVHPNLDVQRDKCARREALKA